MENINVTNARKDLYNLISRTNETHEPVKITGRRANAVLLSEDDWNAITETLYLSNIPGMAKSIRSGAKEPLKDGTNAKDLNWDV